MIDNVPDELKLLRSWCCWKYENVGALKPTKVPYNPVTGYKANVQDASTWVSYEEAKASAHLYDGIGFIFSENDPYCFIDLDDTAHFHNGQPNPNAQADFERQKAILQHFDSYAELSPSGRGVHVIVKASVLAGRRRSFIEVYSKERYATMTGNVINQKPILECQDKLEALWSELGTPPQTILFKGNAVASVEDVEILNMAANASNGQKFKDLYMGNWQQYYQSQSEADYAYIDIVAFYSKNKDQIIRLFHQSALGQRDKAKRYDYVNWMVNKSFDRMLPPIDIDGFRNAIELKIAERLKNKPPYMNGNHVDISKLPAPPLNDPIPLPPGLMGEIAKFIYNAAPRPVPEIAIAGAIGLMAGICGRAYNYSKTGLNHYVLLLANTGRGKEAIASGIDMLMSEVRYLVPASHEFVGPGDIASGQALIRYLSKTSQCFVSVIGEFGIRLQRMSSFNTSPSENALKQNLLDLFNKSAFGKSLKPTIFADHEKNTIEIANPSVSIVGESTPSKFYENLNEGMVTEGLLSRFMVIEYLGIRPPLNRYHDQARPHPDLIQMLADLCAQAHSVMNTKSVVQVKHTDEAEGIFDNFNNECDNRINSNLEDAVIELWNRGDMKAKKLAALVAVGVNPNFPVITAEHALWAIDVTKRDIANMVSRFDRGEIGNSNNDARQIKDMLNSMKKYLTSSYEDVKMYGTPEQLHRERVIPYGYLSRKLIAVSSFRTDRMGATHAIKKTLQTLLDNDDVREIPKSDLSIKYGTTTRSFMLKSIGEL